jgi:hypothetical protein
MMEGVDDVNIPYVLVTRLVLLGFLALLAILIRMAWKNEKPIITDEDVMTTGGLILMILSWAIILILVIFSFSKIMREK